MYAAMGNGMISFPRMDWARVPAWNCTPDWAEVRELLSLTNGSGVGLLGGRASDVVSRARQVNDCRLRFLKENPRHVPPREESYLGRPPPQQMSNVLPTRRNKGPHAFTRGNRNPLDEPAVVKRLSEFLKNMELDEGLMDLIQDRIQAKTKVPDKPHSEIVTELERKERRAVRVELQRAFHRKKHQLAQADVRFMAHLDELDSIKEELSHAHVFQMRRMSRNPHEWDFVMPSDDEENDHDDEAGGGPTILSGPHTIIFGVAREKSW